MEKKKHAQLIRKHKAYGIFVAYIRNDLSEIRHFVYKLYPYVS